MQWATADWILNDMFYSLRVQTSSRSNLCTVSMSRLVPDQTHEKSVSRLCSCRSNPCTVSVSRLCSCRSNLCTVLVSRLYSCRSNPCTVSESRLCGCRSNLCTVSMSRLQLQIKPLQSQCLGCVVADQTRVQSQCLAYVGQIFMHQSMNRCGQTQAILTFDHFSCQKSSPSFSPLCQNPSMH